MENPVYFVTPQRQSDPVLSLLRLAVVGAAGYLLYKAYFDNGKEITHQETK